MHITCCTVVAHVIRSMVEEKAAPSVSKVYA